MTAFPPDRPNYVVKPRTPKVPEHRYIIAVSADWTLCERTGEVHERSALPAILAAEPSSIIVAQDFGGILTQLCEAYRHDPLFNFRLSPRTEPGRKNYSPQTRDIYLTDAICNWLGWKSENKKGGIYHYPLDPVVFCRSGIDELRPEEGIPRAWKLYEWASEIRQWTTEQQLVIKPSSGGLVAQLLRDPRFYPQPRRKAPGLLNDSVRPQLPGNYYHLCAEPGVTYEAAYYLDMSSAHHIVAAGTAFPCVNSLHAYGYWTSRNRVFATGNRMDRMLTRPGLFLLQVSTGSMVRRTRFHLPSLPELGTDTIWAYSNELELVRAHSEITGVICALTSDEPETGMNAYAKFALKQIREHASYKPWLKPTLHSTYGILAARPVPFETGYYRAKSGTPSQYHMGAASLPVLTHSTTKAVESRVANVIHRGMIEAGVRKEAIRQANMMHDDGWHVLAIYADSLFLLDTGRPVGLLDPPWRLAEHLTDLRFDSAVHWIANEAARLPGIRRDRKRTVQLDRELQGEILRAQAAARLNNACKAFRSPVRSGVAHKPTIPVRREHATTVPEGSR